MESIREVFEQALKDRPDRPRRPHRWQERVAEEGLPEILALPTGTGKTAGTVLPWVFRRRFHPDPSVRLSTPHWLVFVLPMRVLVEQTYGVVGGWLKNLSLSSGDRGIGLHVVMGGEDRSEQHWRRHPDRDAIFVGTLDMLLSRGLNRGYGESRWMWPIDFGLFNAGCHWVFDEIQLMGPALATSRQLAAFRRSFGEALPCSSTWMSATVDPDALRTVDNPDWASVIELGEADWTGTLRTRLGATRSVRRLPTSGDAKSYPSEIAGQLLGKHRPGTLTIAVLNTVERARQVHRQLQERVHLASPHPKLVLVHSRFRPDDRRTIVSAALEPEDPGPAGRIVVSTQVIEAGVDVSATTLCTEAAPWPSIVQRAGRCNRDGLAVDAELLWAPPPAPAPYAAPDVDGSCAALAALEGQPVTTTALGKHPVEVLRTFQPVLRRRDLLGLFDTTPDLSGNDLDIAPFLRESDDLDVQVCWRDVPPQVPATDRGTADLGQAPVRRELCPVPIGELRLTLKQGRAAWRHDHQARGWVPVPAIELRPGMVVVLRSSDGGYRPDQGWDRNHAGWVEPVRDLDDPSPLGQLDEDVGDDPVSFASGRWVGLRQHLFDVEKQVRTLAELLALGQSGLSVAHVEAAAVAGRLHDLGKAHPVFQSTMVRTAGSDAEVAMAEGQGPWAKSGGPKKARHRVRFFRHELASALVLLGAGRHCLDGVEEAELTVYLVAAHHGRVRMGIRSLADERPRKGLPLSTRVALGISDGDELPTMEIPGVTLPPISLDLTPMELGDGPDGQPSWSRMALELRDRPDLGPFRLAYLEALVRLADWRASDESDRREGA